MDFFSMPCNSYGFHHFLFLRLYSCGVRPSYFLNILEPQLLAHPEAGKVAGSTMQMLIASRGDVAKSAGDNKNLQKMLNAMSFESILQKAALPPEETKAINDRLQKIRK